MPVAVRSDARAAVLEAAERLFDTRGYDPVSVAELIDASGVSNGSIYHHFGSKEGVLAALVIDALGDYQARLLTVLDAHADDARRGLLAAITFELAWFEEHPRAARLVIAHRDAVAASGAGRDRLRALNRSFARRIGRWLARHHETGALPQALDLNLLHAIVFAPGRELASLWLAGRVKQRPTSFAAALGNAGWAGVCALDL
jgi:AcrR family transcriptional regulator